jgi:hypothetical protein
MKRVICENGDGELIPAYAEPESVLEIYPPLIIMP